MWVLIFFIKFGKFLAIIFSFFLPLPFSYFLLRYYPYISIHNGFPHFSEILFIYLNSLYFLFLRPDILNWFIFKFTHSQLHLLKSDGELHNEFFISYNVFFNSIISIWFFLNNFHIYLLIFCIWWNIISIVSCIISISSFNIFQIGDWKSLYNKFNMSASSGKFLFTVCLSTFMN